MLEMLIFLGTGFALVMLMHGSIIYFVQCAFRATKIKLITIFLTFG